MKYGLMIFSFGLLLAFQQTGWPPAVQKVSKESPALPVDQALKTFFMPPGYHLEPVATEPLVRDPIVMDQDADGRLYVIEMPAFAMDESMKDSFEPICSVVVLEDTNGDGRMDKRTVFMDKLVLPRAVKVLSNGVLVGEPPNLWLAKDTDGDLKADTKELIRSDFGRKEANIEHNANGLYWGMDNTIYTSEHNWNLRWRHGKLEMEPSLVRGQWNISQDDAGRIYRNWNEQPLFVDIIPAKYFLRNPNVVRTRGLYDVLIERHETAIWPVRPTPGLQRAYREGFLRPDGTAVTYASSADPYIFRGDRLPKELQGNAFIGESPTNLVHRLIIDDDGTGRLKARDAYRKGEFLASTDERFRPVNLFSAADGTLYVIDMYRGVVQDIAYQTDYLKTYIKNNKLELPVGLGRIYRVVHDSMKPGPKPALSKATSTQLIDALSHPNGWWRNMAQQILVQRDDASVAPQLKRVAANATDWRTRLHALWTLDGLDAIDAPTVEKALTDKSPDVRAGAVRISERWLRESNHPLHAAVLKRSEDANWSVRRQLAASLGELPQAARTTPIIAMLTKYGDDQIVVDAGISGLAGQEAVALERLLSSSQWKRDDAIAMLAAAITRKRDQPEVQRIFDWSADTNRTMWQRLALLRGVDVGLSAGVGGGGGRPTGIGPASVGFGGSGLGRNRGAGTNPGLSLPAEPKSLTSVAAGTGELAELAKKVAARVTWSGKPVPADQGPKLTPDEEKRVAAGAQIYANACAGCHRADGQGNQGGAPNLAASKIVAANAAAPLRVVLNGKEGATGLMPPMAAALNDEQVAAVVSFIRRSWGHSATMVSVEESKETRGVNSLRKTPWTDAELKRFMTGLR
ncbi:MAG: c-type cytochrome [Acidobacteria bacterium]|nr:c-type cytochrome [Acidobacteriota bacterium]